MVRTALLLTAATFGLGTVAASAQKHIGPPPGTIPGGSYRATCSNIRFQAGNPSMLMAACRPKAADTAAAESRLDIRGCPENSIYNDDSRLKCPFDAGIASRADAVRNLPALRSAGVIVMGRDPDVQTAAKWVTVAGRLGLDQAVRTGTLDFGEAATMLKAYLRQDATPQERRAVFDAAYREVYGTAPGIILPGGDYDAAMTAGTAWYATIVLAERKKKAAAPPPSPANTTPQPAIH